MSGTVFDPGWERIIVGCGGVSILFRGATLASCWLYEPRSIYTQLMGASFPRLAGQYLHGELRFHRRIDDVVDVRRIF